MEIANGAWKIAEHENLYVVLEVTDISAYAYLWDKFEGVLSHVWLFNVSDSNDSSDEFPPPMPDINIKKKCAPDNVDQISCEYFSNDESWNIYFEDQRIAQLKKHHTPGLSELIYNSNEWAVAHQ